MISKLDSIKRKVSFTFVCGKQKRGQVLFKKKGDAEDDEKKTETFFSSLLPVSSVPFVLFLSRIS